MEIISEKIFSDERSLFLGKDLEIYNTVFDYGESPLKESNNIKLYSCIFRWKYPLWYSKNIHMKDCTLLDSARAGIWYTDDIIAEDCIIEAPKTFRRSTGITLQNVSVPHAAETLWNCKNIRISNVSANGDYFAMNSKNINTENFYLTGNYSFDGCENVNIKNSKLISKDAFWNSKNVTVENSFISGEYLGWNAKNLTLINCTIESLQGLCYINNLVMKNCKLINTTLAFEYSTVDAQISSDIESVLNPKSGIIRAEHINELILEKDKIDETKTKIIVSK